MFKKIFKNFDDIDMDKLLEVVNLVWNNREKIMELIERLPEILKETGETIESAGESAIKASAFLSGEGKGGKMTASQVSKIAAEALDRCQEEVQKAAGVMDTIGDELDEINIPSIKPKYIEIFDKRIVGGIDIGEEPLLDNMADRLQDGASRMAEIGKDLDTVAKNLLGLGSALEDAGVDLNGLGEKLIKGGGSLRSLTLFEE